MYSYCYVRSILCILFYCVFLCTGGTVDIQSEDRWLQVDVDWFAVLVTPMHLGLKLQALWAPLLVPSVNSRGAPRHAGVRDLC
jgi:hypothetical protein